MDYDIEKVDEMILALLYLTTFGDQYGLRAWKGFDWETMDRLYQKGYIGDPKTKAKSVIITDEGAELSEKLFLKYFALKNDKNETEKTQT